MTLFALGRMLCADDDAGEQMLSGLLQCAGHGVVLAGESLTMDNLPFM